MRRVVITGCSGAGKSTLLQELERRGYPVVGEPGRRVIAAERASGGTGLPWQDTERFAALCFWMAVGDHAVADAPLTFFDRSALDAAAWFEREGQPVPGDLPGYARDVFLAPPWQELFKQDADRRHDFDAAVKEYDDLAKRLPDWGYSCHLMPKLPVAERADWVLEVLAA